MNEYGFNYLNLMPNIKYDNNLINKSYPMNYINQQPNNTQQLYDPTQGLTKGNLFANLYEPYKNYKPEKLNPESEKEALMLQLMQYKFALKDLNLYLDTHPNDTEIITLYNKYLSIEKQICNNYENMYGPITTDTPNMTSNNFNWINSPWPWEGK